MAIIGPGAILLGISIGSGEWLIGPATTAKYSAALLWVATVSIILRVIMNTEFARYTLYTGQPIYTGFMRTKPGPAFWGIVYSVLAFLQVGWPGGRPCGGSLPWCWPPSSSPSRSAICPIAMR